MFSRFSKLLNNSSYSSLKVYERADIDRTVADIKKLGKRAVDNSDECLQDIEKILIYMRRFEQCIQIQRVGCHALSNLAMHVVAARWIIQKNGFKLIKRAVDHFREDHKLCWLAASAVWNLARPPTNRSVIGSDGVSMMFMILSVHVDREKVCNTAIGALSNLSLQDDLKDQIADPENMDVILRALSTHSKLRSLSVMTSGAGLLANLAVNDDHADVLVEKNVLSILMDLLSWQTKQSDNREETLFRNSCAAMNNMVTAEGYLDSFLLNLGTEKVFEFLSVHRENELYMNLLENCLSTIDCDSSKATTSFHLASAHGKVDVFKTLYETHKHDFLLDSLDEHNMSVLDYAMKNEHAKMVQLLSKCGATKYTSEEETISESMKDLMSSSQEELRSIKSENNKALVESLPHFPVDVCKYMLTFQHNVDMLKGVQSF